MAIKDEAFIEKSNEIIGKFTEISIRSKNIQAMNAENIREIAKLRLQIENLYKRKT